MLKIEDLYQKYMDGNVEDRITNHLKETNPQFKKMLDDYNDMVGKFEEMVDEKASNHYDNAIYQKLLLEEFKLVHAFKEGVLIATQISQEVALNQNKV